MNIKEAVNEAMKEPTLLEAQTFICIWEMERVVKYVRSHNGSWETCFKICLNEVTDAWEKEK